MSRHQRRVGEHFTTGDRVANTQQKQGRPVKTGST